MSMYDEDIDYDPRRPEDALYRSKEDKMRLMAMKEIERESILARREQQHVHEQDLQRALRKSHDDGFSSEDDEDELVRRSVKNQRAEEEEEDEDFQLADDDGLSDDNLDLEEEEEYVEVVQEPSEKKRKFAAPAPRTSYEAPAIKVIRKNTPPTLKSLRDLQVLRDELWEMQRLPYMSAMLSHNGSVAQQKQNRLGRFVRVGTGTPGVYRVCEILEVDCEKLPPYKWPTSDGRVLTSRSKLGLKVTCGNERFWTSALEVSNGAFEEADMDRWLRRFSPDHRPSKEDLELALTLSDKVQTDYSVMHNARQRSRASVYQFMDMQQQSSYVAEKAHLKAAIAQRILAQKHEEKDEARKKAQAFARAAKLERQRRSRKLSPEQLEQQKRAVEELEAMAKAMLQHDFQPKQVSALPCRFATTQETEETRQVRRMPLLCGAVSQARIDPQRFDKDEAAQHLLEIAFLHEDTPDSLKFPKELVKRLLPHLSEGETPSLQAMLDAFQALQPMSQVPINFDWAHASKSDVVLEPRTRSRRFRSRSHSRDRSERSGGSRFSSRPPPPMPPVSRPPPPAPPAASNTSSTSSAASGRFESTRFSDEPRRDSPRSEDRYHRSSSGGYASQQAPPPPPPPVGAAPPTSRFSDGPSDSHKSSSRFSSGPRSSRFSDHR